MSIKRFSRAASWLPAALLAGCLASAEAPEPPLDPALARPIFLVSFGWHTRVAVRQADVPPGVWSESRALGRGRYVEVGWGNRAYYQADEPTIPMALGAVLWPTPAALHVAVFDDICAARAGLDVVRIDVSPRGVERLARFVSAAYERDARGDAVPTKPGHDPLSAFYLATGRYHAFSTSNTWTARALREAGADVAPSGTIFASGVLRQARAIGVSACEPPPRARR